MRQSGDNWGEVEDGSDWGGVKDGSDWASMNINSKSRYLHRIPAKPNSSTLAPAQISRFHCYKHLLPSMGDKARVVDEMLSRAIHANPNDPYAWHMLGVRCFSQKFYDEALHCFQKAESIKESFSASNLYYLGACLKEQGSIEESKFYLKKAVHTTTRNAVDDKGKEAAAKLLRDLQLGDC
ncbi:unnamed protein product, partial [Mesorhabditis belari]|uniref:Uncharacterized protein n=1 Tax=Mesorhabditis belari TaxID=2138241 RepID=A0AAF3JAR5_9BILA